MNLSNHPTLQDHVAAGFLHGLKKLAEHREVKDLGPDKAGGPGSKARQAVLAETPPDYVTNPSFLARHGGVPGGAVAVGLPMAAVGGMYGAALAGDRGALIGAGAGGLTGAALGALIGGSKPDTIEPEELDSYTSAAANVHDLAGARHAGAGLGGFSGAMLGGTLGAATGRGLLRGVLPGAAVGSLMGTGAGYAAGSALGEHNRYELTKAVREAHGLSNEPLNKAAGYSHADLSSAEAPDYVTAAPTRTDKVLNALARTGMGAATGASIGGIAENAAPGSLSPGASLARQAVYTGTGALIGGGLGAASNLLPSHKMTGDEYGALTPDMQLHLRQTLPHRPLIGGLGGGMMGALGGTLIGGGLGTLAGRSAKGTLAGMGAGALGGAVLGAGLGVHSGKQDQRETVRAIREYRGLSNEAPAGAP
jgi:hypothetical protein